MSNSERNSAASLTLSTQPRTERPERRRTHGRLQDRQRPRLRVITGTARTLSRFRYGASAPRAKHVGAGRHLRTLKQHVAAAPLGETAASDAAPTHYRVAAIGALALECGPAPRLTGKRLLDVFGALALIVVFAPVLLLVALLVSLTGPGPVLFKQSRLGLDGKPFTCFKFRTMVADAEMQLRQSDILQQLHLAEYKIKDDPRITPIGRFLRQCSLDELPQLFNVLDGTMSLVGPRPIVPEERAKYGVYAEKLLRVQPGLTGVWQVCGRSDVSYDERVLMDMFYVDHGSLLMDVWLLLSTVTCVVRRSGAY